MRALLIPAITKFLGGLRFRNLFLITAALFVATLVIPDVIPFADEILLGLATLLLARWKERKTATEAPAERAPIDVPPGDVRRG